VLFRSETLGKAWYLMQSMVGLHGIDWQILRQALGAPYWALVLFCLLVTNFAPNTWQIRLEPKKRYALALGLAMAACILMLGQRSPFLYFQF
jgi:alginate O-acetyltransferase complex protein AlgI